MLKIHRIKKIDNDINILNTIDNDIDILIINKIDLRKFADEMGSSSYDLYIKNIFKILIYRFLKIIFNFNVLF